MTVPNHYVHDDPISTKDEMVRMARCTASAKMATFAKSHDETGLLAGCSVRTAEVLDTGAHSGGRKEPGVKVKRARTSRGVCHRIIDFHRTVVIPSLGDYGVPILIDRTNFASVWQGPVHVDDTRLGLGGRKTRVELDLLGVSFCAREREWTLRGRGLGWLIDIQRLVEQSV
jgi:hypothetical protein